MANNKEKEYSAKVEDLQKPITMRIEEFKANLNQVVAESMLPPFLLEVYIGEYLSGISRVADQERAQDREEWENQSKEAEDVKHNE